MNQVILPVCLMRSYDSMVPGFSGGSRVPLNGVLGSCFAVGSEGKKGFSRVFLEGGFYNGSCSEAEARPFGEHDVLGM